MRISQHLLCVLNSTPDYVLLLLGFSVLLVLATCKLEKARDSNLVMVSNIESYMKSDYITGTLLTFTCKTGYKLIGSKILQCQMNGVWSPKELPTCESTSPSIVSLIYLSAAMFQKKKINGGGGRGCLEFYLPL